MSHHSRGLLSTLFLFLAHDVIARKVEPSLVIFAVRDILIALAVLRDELLTQMQIALLNRTLLFCILFVAPVKDAAAIGACLDRSTLTHYIVTELFAVALEIDVVNVVQNAYIVIKLG